MAVSSRRTSASRRVAGARSQRTNQQVAGCFSPHLRTFHWISYYIVVITSFRHSACCLGDTLASELGILSQSRPFLITTFKRVPPGTNGGMSLLGTFCSILGGCVIGLTYLISLYWGNPACRGQIGLELISWGAIGGGLGSLVGHMQHSSRPI